ncbi:MAG TPA: hypothetical protein VFF96_11230, partial [Pseudoxanthomonas sp.]|nr:hypothetical protein [Pseudoxanthomonas sp.]
MQQLFVLYAVFRTVSLDYRARCQPTNPRRRIPPAPSAHAMDTIMKTSPLHAAAIAALAAGVAACSPNAP